MIAARLSIPGHPIAKGRPRMRVIRTTAGRTFASAYTPAATREAEDTIAGAALRSVEAGASRPVMDGALSLEVTLWRVPPQSASRVKRAAMLSGMIHPTTKPDLDNCAKLVLDALNGILFRDDAQIVDLVVRKRYAERPGTEVVVRELVGDGVRR